MDENSKIVALALVTLVDNLGTLYLGYRMGIRIKNGPGPGPDRPANPPAGGNLASASDHAS